MRAMIARFRAYERDFSRPDARRRLRDIAAASGSPQLTLAASATLAGMIAVSAGLADSIATSASRQSNESRIEVTSILDALWSEHFEDPLQAELSDIVSVAVLTLGLALGDPNDPAAVGRSTFAQSIADVRTWLVESEISDRRNEVLLGQEIAIGAKWRPMLEMRRAPKFRRLLKEFNQSKDPDFPLIPLRPSALIRSQSTLLSAESIDVKAARFQARRPSGNKTQGSGDVSVQAPPRSLKPSLAQRELADLEPGDRRIRVHFGTDRELLEADSKHFGGARAADNATRYGVATVFVPKSHHVGKLGYSAIIAPNRIARNGALFIQQVTHLTKLDFERAIHAELGVVTTRRILLSIHGFSTTFDTAILRTAQLAADLDIDAVVAAFSWPSAGSLLHYSRDRTEALASAPGLAAFLLLLAENSAGLRNVDVVVHSMGNYVLANAVQALRVALASAGLKLGHIFLAAPDIDLTEFSALAVARRGISRSGTVYASRNDLALLVSALIHRSPRVGRFPPVPAPTGIHKVDVSAVNLPMIGHGYHAQTGAVIDDIVEVILHNKKPNKRRRLYSASAGTHWIMRP